ncbi:MAG: FkbM family methyltransferase [Sphingomicrobium sp.]
MVTDIGNFERDLIFDVGACHGDDSAYYLHKGYRVVAVEPDPRSVAHLKQRFADEIAQGRLSLVEAAIADEEGTASFWQCEDVPGWSSFAQSNASANGARHHRIVVPTLRFRSLIEKFGTPLYCKIDIEGSDQLCLDDLTPDTRPPFTSIEIAYDGSTVLADRTRALFGRLEALCYSRFKLISQVSFRQPSMTFARVRARLPSSIGARLTAFTRWRRRRETDWIFDGDSSGPFGDATDGQWQTSQEARQLIAIILRNRDISDWFDIHAAT